MNFTDVVKKLDTEEKCIKYMKSMRWPNGARCPECNHDKISEFETKGKTGKTRHLYQCLNKSCRYQFTVTTGTIFHNSHLPLQKWFLAIAMIHESKGQVSANQLSRSLDVQYKTAWQLMKHLKETMVAESADTERAGGSTDGTKTAEIWDAKNFFPAQKLPDEKPVQVTKSVEQKVQKKAEPPQPTSQQSPNLPGWEEALFEMTISNLVRGMQLPYKGLVSGFELSRSAFRLILEPIAERVDRALGFNPKKEPAQTTKR